MFEGSIVALVTPFKNGKVDESKLRELVEFHVKNGTSGIVPCGTTGESATLTHEEHNSVIEVVIEAAKKRIKIIAGTGSNSTAEAIDMTRLPKRRAPTLRSCCRLITISRHKGAFICIIRQSRIR